MQATQALFLCNKANKKCKHCIDNEYNLCRHTTNPEYAVHPDSIDVYNEFIKRFKTSSVKVDGDITAIIFEEREW